MDVAVSFSKVITAAKRYVSWRPLMKLFLRILLLHATCHRNAYSYLDQLCDLGNPQFRMTLLQDAMGRLDGKYDITNGLAAFGVCDPTDPNINPDCLNYNNPSVAYGSTLVPCPDEKCPLETPESFVRGKSGFYQPIKITLWCCLVACRRRQSILEFGHTCMRKLKVTFKLMKIFAKMQ